MSQECFKAVKKEVSKCFKFFQEYSRVRVSVKSFEGVSRNIEWCFHGVSGKLYEYFFSVSRKCSGFLKNVSRKFCFVIFIVACQSLQLSKQRDLDGFLTVINYIETKQPSHWFDQSFKWSLTFLCFILRYFSYVFNCSNLHKNFFVWDKKNVSKPLFVTLISQK